MRRPSASERLVQTHDCLKLRQLPLGETDLRRIELTLGIEHFQIARNTAAVPPICQPQVFLTRALEDEHVGLEESGDEIWSVYFANFLLGKFSERDFRIWS